MTEHVTHHVTHCVSKGVSAVASPPDREDRKLVDQAATAAAASGILTPRELGAGKAFGESVRDVQCPGTFYQSQDSVTHEVANKVQAHVNVTRELAVHRIVRDRDARRVVLPHDGGLRLLVTKAP
eukprot:3751687-Rhodomonas_salina.3